MRSNIDFIDDLKSMLAELLSIHVSSAKGGSCAMNNLSCRLWAACAAGILVSTERAMANAPVMDTNIVQNRVLLVHGIADSAASMRLLRARLARDGRETLAINLKPGDGRISLESSSLQLRDYVRTHFSARERIDLVGFSMGGLVCRYYIQMLEGSSRVDRLVTISTPNHGTLLAFLNRRIACQEMRPGSDFLRKLNDDWSTLREVEVTSFWTPLDLVIIPAESSRLPIGINKPMPVLAHPLMILQRRPIEEVANALSQPLVRLRKASALPAKLRQHALVGRDSVEQRRLEAKDFIK